MVDLHQGAVIVLQQLGMYTVWSLLSKDVHLFLKNVCMPDMHATFVPDQGKANGLACFL